MGYSTEVPPLLELCDNCYKKLSENSVGTILICGHRFHWHCYSKMELKKEDNTLTDNDGLEEEYQDLEDIDKPEDIQENEVVIDLQSALDNVDRW
ncbi:8739_t:CDS:2 [Gigaspora rosea]|nr:8739_t:CDS:2 [Gigaspora rosea]